VDQTLGLTLWPPAGRTRPVGLPPTGPLELSGRPTDPDDDTEAAPSWWHGDEEASQAFLKAEGIALE
jgi:hypothetical protein